MACLGDATNTLENENVKFVFTDDGALLSFVDKESSQDLSSFEEGQSVWEVEVVDTDGAATMLPPTDGTPVLVTRPDDLSLSLSWPRVAVPSSSGSSIHDMGTANVTLSVSFRSTTADLAEWLLHVTFNEDCTGRSVGIWQASISVPLTVGSGSDGELFFPNAYGMSLSDPLSPRSLKNTNGYVKASYPSGGVAMQFMALGRETSVPTSAAYVGTHDPDGYVF